MDPGLLSSNGSSSITKLISFASQAAPGHFYHRLRRSFRMFAVPERLSNLVRPADRLVMNPLQSRATAQLLSQGMLR